MNSVKLSKKRPFIIVILTLVLLFVLCVPSFAISVNGSSNSNISEGIVYPVGLENVSLWDFSSSSNSLVSVAPSSINSYSPVYPPYTNYSLKSFSFNLSRRYTKESEAHLIFTSDNPLTASSLLDELYCSFYVGTFHDSSLVLDSSLLIAVDYSFYNKVTQSSETYLNFYTARINLNDNQITPIQFSFDITPNDLITNYDISKSYFKIRCFLELSTSDGSQEYFTPSFIFSDLCFSTGGFVLTPSDSSIPVVPLEPFPIPTPDTSHIDDTLNDLNTVEGELPKVDKDKLAELMDFDFSQFSGSLSFIRSLFERTMDTFNFNAVLIFALTVGLAAYVIGRKVK